jgi:hypothetical protein
MKLPSNLHLYNGISLVLQSHAKMVVEACYVGIVK